MSRIRAVRNDGQEYSKAEGSLKVILKMISSLPESKTRQIIINKKQLDSFIEENRFMSSTLYNLKIYDCMSQKTLHGKMKRTLGMGYDCNFELYHVDPLGTEHYILAKVLVDGRVVYIAPQKINSNDGLMELSI